MFCTLNFFANIALAGWEIVNVLLLNQTFYPDVAATAHYLADLAVALAERGHSVTVLTSRRAYDDPNTIFPAHESWRGVNIVRLPTTAFGKKSKWRRALDFASFIGSCVLRLLALRRPDAVVALTSPPLISFIGALYARLRGARFFYWVMDLNPDEAEAAGWLKKNSLPARVLHWMSRYSFRHAEKIFALDHFMQSRITAKNISAERIAVIPPWSHDGAVQFDPTGREKFRRAHGLTDKFVVMYSGNHSPCHPLETLLAAAQLLSANRNIVFCFVGGGSEWRKINEALSAGTSGTNILQTNREERSVMCLPYQPASELSASLSAADLHVVVMGEPFVGIIHPCKIYNIIGVGAPVLYIGPEKSHVAEVLGELNSAVCARVAHGDAAGCADAIKRIASQNARGEPERFQAVAEKFSRSVWLPRMVALIEGRDGKGQGR